MKYLNKTKDILLELIYPNRCIVCNEVIEFMTDRRLCPECKDKVKPITGRVCDICGVPIISNNICSDCRGAKLYFKKVYPAYEYKDEIRKIVHNIKFHDHPQYIKYFADILCGYAKSRGFENADTVTYVPMHPKKQKIRGYNQGEILAKEIAKRGMGEFKQLLEKVIDTKNQHDISKEERRKNLKGAFKAINTEYIVGKKILLVDDIYTTGTTVNECAKTLIKAGAESVEIICIAIVNKRD